MKELGWSDWFEQRAACRPSETIARVAAVDRELFLLMEPSGSFRARLAGGFLHRQQLQHELPCVGDWVCVERRSGDDLGLIHALLPRKTSLRRRAAGAAIEYQMIAANVDHVIIVQSCQFDFNVKRLERYLVMVRDGGAQPSVLLTKTDIVEPGAVEAQLSEIRAAGIDVPLFSLSNVTREGFDEFRQRLLPGETYCFVGSSGVGKSTLINHLLGRAVQETRSVSGTGEGRHTTVRRQLIVLEGGALVIDNPGMREFGVLGAEEGLAGSFSDIMAFASNCRYRDCSHACEPGCAVLEAVQSGEISQEHYDSYVKLREESEFYQMSYVEKRKKDRRFGRLIKSVKKDLRRK